MLVVASLGTLTRQRLALADKMAEIVVDGDSFSYDSHDIGNAFITD